MTIEEIKQIIESSSLHECLKEVILDRVEIQQQEIDDYGEGSVDPDCDFRQGVLICDLEACLAFLRENGIGDIATKEEDETAEQYLKDYFKKVFGKQNIRIMTEDDCVLYKG